MRRVKISTILASAVMAAAVLLSAWKGSLDWMGFAVFALAFKLPGARMLHALFKGKGNCDVGRD